MQYKEVMREAKLFVNGKTFIFALMRALSYVWFPFSCWEVPRLLAQVRKVLTSSGFRAPS